MDTPSLRRRLSGSNNLDTLKMPSLLVYAISTPERRVHVCHHQRGALSLALSLHTAPRKASRPSQAFMDAPAKG